LVVAVEFAASLGGSDVDPVRGPVAGAGEAFGVDDSPDGKTIASVSTDRTVHPSRVDQRRPGPPRGG